MVNGGNITVSTLYIVYIYLCLDVARSILDLMDPNTISLDNSIFQDQASAPLSIKYVRKLKTKASIEEVSYFSVNENN